MANDDVKADVARIGKRRDNRRALLKKDTDELRAAVLRAIEAGCSENELAEIGKVDRMTIRGWLGKPARRRNDETPGGSA